MGNGCLKYSLSTDIHLDSILTCNGWGSCKAEANIKGIILEDIRRCTCSFENGEWISNDGVSIGRIDAPEEQNSRSDGIDTYRADLQSIIDLAVL